MLVLLVPGVLVAFLRQPVYTAEARVLVGSFDAQVVPGVVEASQSLAETYGRLISTDAVVRLAADELGVSQERVRGQIGGSSIPESALIRVRAKSTSAQNAMRLADAAATALVEYASRGGRSGETVLDQYEDALLELSTARTEVARLTALVEAEVAAGDSDGAAEARTALAQAEVAVERARLRSQSLAGQYAETLGSTGTLQVVGEAIDTGSDRRSILQLAVGAAVVLGPVIGITLATIVVNREASTGSRARRASEG